MSWKDKFFSRSTTAPQTQMPITPPVGHQDYSDTSVEHRNPLQTFIETETGHCPVRPGSTYMDEEQQAFFRNTLHNWRNDLLRSGDATILDLQESGQNTADLSDLATQEETFNLRLKTRDRERKLIKKIDEVLQLIDNNLYGYCEECAVEIGIRRLEARPTATLCIDCKTVDEVKERHRRSSSPTEE